ncbi:MAG: hypothetical protein MK334_01190 [SAR202 cluster bacterium]|nr:hypothetical protein [SAR202 cluster bacterium]
METPPYISFNTFKTLLYWLEKEGVPLRIDRSFWKEKFSGANGSKLMGSLRFLGLLDGDKPTKELEILVSSSLGDERSQIFVNILTKSYRNIPFEELARATPNMIKEWFRVYPIDGHTLRKATTFFINAAREAQIPMSNSIIKMTKSRRINSQQQIKSLNAASEEIATINKRTPAVNKLQDSETLRNSTTIPLSNGGTVVVDVAVNLFSLSEEDRSFVFSIVDLAKSYTSSK